MEAIIITGLVSFIIYIVIAYLAKPEKDSFIVTTTPKDPRLWNYDQKQEYLKSLDWRVLQIKVLDRDRYQCKACNSTNNLEIHHITYKRLGSEHLSDLVCLCNSCHSKLHQKLGYSQFSNYPIEELNENCLR